jgi:hypothetical protein
MAKVRPQRGGRREQTFELVIGGVLALEAAHHLHQNIQHPLRQTRPRSSMPA